MTAPTVDIRKLACDNRHIKQVSANAMTLGQTALQDNDTQLIRCLANQTSDRIKSGSLSKDGLTDQQKAIVAAAGGLS